MLHGRYGRSNMTLRYTQSHSEQSRTMKVLVTGSEGYIGTNLVQVLLKKGYEITGLDTGFYMDGHLYDDEREEYPFIRKDIRQVAEDDLRGFDVIVHLAELSNDPVGQNNPELTYEINHRGTVRIANLAKKVGIKRFIYASSCSVYGASDALADETSATNPLTAYAKSKVLNEAYLLQIADDSFSPVILRFATVFGPSPRMRFDIAVNNLSGLAYTLKEIKMDSDGTPWRPFTHVLDICEAIHCALQAPIDVVHGEIFNVGGLNANYQIKDIAEIIKETIPGCTVTMNPHGADKRNYKVNFDKINTKLPNFKATRDVRKGVQELLAIFQRINMTKELFEANEYTRLKQIKHLLDTKKIDDKFFWL